MKKPRPGEGQTLSFGLFLLRITGWVSQEADSEMEFRKEGVFKGGSLPPTPVKGKEGMGSGWGEFQLQSDPLTASAGLKLE